MQAMRAWDRTGAIRPICAQFRAPWPFSHSASGDHIRWDGLFHPSGCLL